MENRNIIIPAPDGGLRTSVAPSLIADNELARAENVEFVNGRIRKRPGTAGAAGSANTNALETRAIYNFMKTDGTEIPIMYDRGVVGSLTKEIYYGTPGTTWTWTKFEKSGSAWNLDSERTPKFVTFAGKVFFTNGDTTDGLLLWTGSGDITAVDDTGTTSCCGRFMTVFKETLVIANGDYMVSGSYTGTRQGSTVFFSSITDSTGTPVTPDDATAWHEVALTYEPVAVDDGSDITALWAWKDRIYVAKTTGIWVLYGFVKNFNIQQITDIGMESDNSLQEYKGRYIFHNSKGFYAFDGASQPQRIDEAISDKVVMIPTFAIASEGDSLQDELDTAAEWTAANDTAVTSDVTVDSEGFIDIDNSGTQTIFSYGGTGVELSTTGYTGFGWKFIPTKSFNLETVTIVLYAGSVGQTGTLYCTIYKGEYCGQNQISDTQTINVATLSTTAGPTATETLTFTMDEVVRNNQHYWIAVTWTGQSSVTDIRSMYATISWVNKTYALYNVYWQHNDARRGLMTVTGNYFETTGTYQTFTANVAGVMDLGAIPTAWGEFSVTETNAPEGGSVVYSMATSSDKITWTSFVEVEPNTIIDKNVITPYRYVAVKAVLTAWANQGETPIVHRIAINAFTEGTDMVAYSTTELNDKYRYATNKNLDGVYRTFVLDNQNRWSIDPYQYIRGFMTYQRELYVATATVNASTGVVTSTTVNQMFRGHTASHFFYDYTNAKPTWEDSNSPLKWYSQIFETKKFDLNSADMMKLFTKIYLSVGSVFGTNYVIGTLKYRTDDNDWTTMGYFQDKTDSGDVSIVRAWFPEAVRGETIQFRFETYLYGTTNYGYPFNFKNAKLFYKLQEIQPTTEITTAIGSVDSEHVIE